MDPKEVTGAGDEAALNDLTEPNFAPERRACGYPRACSFGANNGSRKCKTALAVQAVLSFSLCYLLERGNLPKEVSFWLSRAAKHLSAWIHIRNDARLRSDLCALTDPKMPGHSCLPPDTNEILKHG